MYPKLFFLAHLCFKAFMSLHRAVRHGFESHSEHSPCTRFITPLRVSGYSLILSYSLFHTPVVD